MLPFEFTRVASLADVPLAEAKRAVIISGITPPFEKGWLGGISASIETANPPESPFAKGGLQTCTQAGIKLAFILDAPNSFGCALLAAEQGALPLSKAIDDNRIKGIITFETDLPDELPEGVRVLGAADWRPTGLLARAEVVLPACAWVEQDGTFVNNEGRAQRFRKIMRPGLPIKGLTPELHPPRTHRPDTPGGDVLPAWQIVSELLEKLGESPVDAPLTGRWEMLQGLDAESSGELLNSSK